MKTVFALMTTAILFTQTPSLACSGCSKSKSGNISSNIQSTMGNPSASLSGARIVGSTGPVKQFKNDKVFESVGRDQGEIDPNWKSSITE